MPFLLFILLSISLFADDSYIYSDEPAAVEQKVLYLTYEKFPKRLIKNQKFSITLKVLSTEEIFDDISYTFANAKGVKLLNTKPLRKDKEPYFYDTFNFIATSSDLRTPDITASLEYNGVYKSYPTTIEGKKINVITLNADKDFSHIIADSLSLTRYKTTPYDSKHNVVIFTLQANNADLNATHLNSVDFQGQESLEHNQSISKLTYYAVVSKSLEDLHFNYYNLKENRYKNILIPIIVDDDSVSTQSDLKPIENRQRIIKLIIVAVVVLVALIVMLLYKKYSLILVIIVGAIYIIYNFVPLKAVCVEAKSPLYLLPMHHGTILEEIPTQNNFEVLNRVDDFYKIKYKNKIGWIQNENICPR